MQSGNEAGFDYPHDSDGEPNEDDLKSVTYACGHPSLTDRLEDDPGPDDVCWLCQPCSSCGEKVSDCVCWPADPFAEMETEAEAQARMTPEERIQDDVYKASLRTIAECRSHSPYQEATTMEALTPEELAADLAYREGRR